MSPKKAALLVMAKIAQADGSVAVSERELLEPLVDTEVELEGLLHEAQAAELVQLVGRLDRYADRFFVALRAATMAHIDGHFASGEQALYSDLLRMLELRPEDVELIETSMAQLDSIEPVEPDPRIGELFEQSSFS